MNDDDIPLRVREAEGNRRFTERLARGELGCECGHLPVEHLNRGYGQRRGACEVVECGCQKWTYPPARERMARNWVPADDE